MISLLSSYRLQLSVATVTLVLTRCQWDEFFFSSYSRLICVWAWSAHCKLVNRCQWDTALHLLYFHLSYERICDFRCGIDLTYHWEECNSSTKKMIIYSSWSHMSHVDNQNPLESPEIEQQRRSLDSSAFSLLFFRHPPKMLGLQQARTLLLSISVV